MSWSSDDKALTSDERDVPRADPSDRDRAAWAWNHVDAIAERKASVERFGMPLADVQVFRVE